MKGAVWLILLLLILTACGITVFMLGAFTDNVGTWSGLDSESNPHDDIGETQPSSDGENGSSDGVNPTGSQEGEEIKNSTPSGNEENDSNDVDTPSDIEGSNDGGENQASNGDTSTPAETIEEEIHNKIASMTLKEKVAQLFIITPEALTGYKKVTEAGDVTKQALSQYPVGGLIYFSQNLVNEKQVKELLSTTAEYGKEINGLPLFLSVDEEGGTVARIANNEAFSVAKTGDMAEIGAKEDYNAAYQVGVTIGSYLSDLGFNLDYAPVADVYSNPENQIVKKRSFGSNPEVVSKMDKLVLQGLKEQQVWGVYKHFPGHGSTVGDTHEGYSYTDKTLEELLSDELLPFIDGISEGIEFIMVGHISAPNIIGDETPSSLSYHMITEILREQLGYDGVVMTDALNMNAIQNQYSPAEAAVMTIEAGADILLMPANFEEAYQGVLAAVENGTITETRIDASLKRILKIKLS